MGWSRPVLCPQRLSDRRITQQGIFEKQTGESRAFSLPPGIQNLSAILFDADQHVFLVHRLRKNTRASTMGGRYFIPSELYWSSVETHMVTGCRRTLLHRCCLTFLPWDREHASWADRNLRSPSSLQWSSPFCCSEYPQQNPEHSIASLRCSQRICDWMRFCSERRLPISGVYFPVKWQPSSEHGVSSFCSPRQLVWHRLLTVPAKRDTCTPSGSRSIRSDSESLFS